VEFLPVEPLRDIRVLFNPEGLTSCSACLNECPICLPISVPNSASAFSPALRLLSACFIWNLASARRNTAGFGISKLNPERRTPTTTTEQQTQKNAHFPPVPNGN
jgi:hypothetical protein